jgi:hypothetical protein
MGTISISFMGIGLLFDVLSLFYGVASLLGRRYMSGFLFIALPFYAIGSVFLDVDTLSLPLFRENVALGKLAIFLAYCGLHVLCQTPGFFARHKHGHN